MRRWLIAGVVFVPVLFLVAIFAVPIGALLSLLGIISGADSPDDLSSALCSRLGSASPVDFQTTARGYTPEQVKVGQIAIGQVLTHSEFTPTELHLLSVTTIAAGLVESELKNVHYGLGSSYGFLQQLDAWGTADERTDVATATEMFLTGGHNGYSEPGATDIPGWRTMAPGVLAGEVQKNALIYRHRYSDRQAEAERFVGTLPDASFGQVAQVASPEIGCIQLAGAASDTSIAERAVQVAWSMRGSSYSQLPGLRENPTVRSFDCSGLTHYSYKQVGLEIGVTSRDQWQVSGPVVPGTHAEGTPATWLTKLEVGDLLFYGSNLGDPQSISHVAIYAGSGQLIDAPKPGAFVGKRPVYWSFGSVKFFGATRPAASKAAQALAPGVNTGWQLPLRIDYAKTSPYGMRVHPVTGIYKLHDGQDMSASTGTPIYAAHAGKVTFAQYATGYGYWVNIDHGAGIKTGYAHLSSFAVKAGETVRAGQLIGYVGMTGYVTGPHLHFMVWQDGKTTDPVKFYNSVGLNL